MNSFSLAVSLLCILPLRLFGQNAAVYEEWLANRDRDPAASRLIDYSYAGYHGGKCHPTKLEGPIFRVTDFGAVPDDGLDDIGAVQNAVDAACSNGGGVVLFPAGTFDFDVDNQTKNPNVRIWADNVVVRGAGSGENGTVIIDHKPNDAGDWTTVKVPNFFSFSSADMHDQLELWYPNSEWDRTAPLTAIEPASRLSSVLKVADASKLAVGQTCTITQSDPDRSLARAMSPGSPSYGDRPGATGTDYKAIKFRQMVRITAISGNEITVDNPVVMELQERWTPTLWPPEHRVIREVGLEDLRLKMDMPQPFVHHDGAAKDYGYNQVRFDWVENGWVRNLVSDGATCAVSLRDSKNCEVLDCSVVGGEGHFGYEAVGHSSRNLVLNLDGNTQFHTFTIGGGVGNVFKDCKAGEPGALDSHGGLTGMYTLVDNLSGCIGAGGGAPKTVPPNHGIGLTLWNWQLGNNSPYNKKPQDVFVDVTAYHAFNAPGFIAAGVRAKDGHPVFYTDLNKERQTADLNEIWGYAEAINKGAVQPASLYDAQKTVRLTSGWCELISPGAGVCFGPDTRVTLQADASARSGRSVSNVEFLEGGQPVGSATAAPYSLAWKPKAMGVYQISARMTDNKGGTITSEAAPVVVGRTVKMENTDPAICYTGDVKPDKGENFSGGSAHWIKENTSADFTFKGTRLLVFTGDRGKCKIYLDDMDRPAKVWDSDPARIMPNYQVYDSGLLKDGVHTVRITNNGYGFDLDYVTATKTD